MNGIKDDKVLFERVRTRSDKNAYRILYLQYNPPLKAYASLFVGFAEAEDVAQPFLVNSGS